jgi:hypothetical protein
LKKVNSKIVQTQNLFKFERFLNLKMFIFENVQILKLFEFENSKLKNYSKSKFVQKLKSSDFEIV